MKHFEGHKYETDPRDIDYLINKGYNNLEWVIKKYNATEDTEDNNNTASTSRTK
ncbi:hypothetical protein SAMD00019534_110060 [Acytostelium subglobosum LB1]|uniref:hypothetical protein n=1 Tax=Acytostelium subglobosum LB1 TaxID=1410327 RepID=UPI000644EE9C|nr:hypothetical protein SAMD00019534_110060 [Acytostelium subglobosum LB1]GAM27830.1 hypothetical protein SAMD00019534_110060 [Acytostelium subglobosum LB1]|eukprot:XP_012749113.1 hypothetical protein SAMD00019534_110060 [Acytostelium subglobosum LB1]